MSDKPDPLLLLESMRDEALSLNKMLSGESRVDYLEWLRQRAARGRTVPGGGA